MQLPATKLSVNAIPSQTKTAFVSWHVQSVTWSVGTTKTWGPLLHILPTTLLLVKMNSSCSTNCHDKASTSLGMGRHVDTTHMKSYWSGIYVINFWGFSLFTQVQYLHYGMYEGIKRVGRLRNSFIHKRVHESLGQGTASQNNTKLADMNSKYRYLYFGRYYSLNLFPKTLNVTSQWNRLYKIFLKGYCLIAYNSITMQKLHTEIVNDRRDWQMHSAICVIHYRNFLLDSG